MSRFVDDYMEDPAADGAPPRAPWKQTVEWPIGKSGSTVVVVLGREEAHQLAPVLIDESAEPDNPDARAVIASIESLDYPPDRLALEIRGAGIEVAYLVLPRSYEALEYGGRFTAALDEAGLPAPSVTILPSGWQLSDVLADLAPQRGLFEMVMNTLWLATPPPEEHLKIYLKTLAEGS
jgi:hypothetical protein